MSRRLLLLLALALVSLVTRVAWSGWSQLGEARDFEQRSESHEAAVRYGRALHMYLPGSPLGDRASERLLALADAAADDGDRWEERFCLEELRSGWLAVRSTWQPGQRWIALADERLLALMMNDPEAVWPPLDMPPAKREAILRQALEPPEDPRLPFVLLMGLGYFVWLGAAAAAIWRGFPAQGEDRTDWRMVGRWGALSAGGYLLWLLGLGLA